MPEDKSTDRFHEGEGNRKLLSNSGGHFLNILGQHDLSASLVQFIFLYMHFVVLPLGTAEQVFRLIKSYIHSCFCDPILILWEKIQSEASVYVWSSQLSWTKPRFHETYEAPFLWSGRRCREYNSGKRSMLA